MWLGLVAMSVRMQDGNERTVNVLKTMRERNDARKTEGLRTAHVSCSGRMRWVIATAEAHALSLPHRPACNVRDGRSGASWVSCPDGQPGSEDTRDTPARHRYFAVTATLGRLAVVTLRWFRQLRSERLLAGEATRTPRVMLPHRTHGVS